jgi:mRNA interferase MazF
MKRGDVWWATLPPSVGSSPGGRRPVVVIQSDLFIRSRIRTVIVIILTSNLDLAGTGGNVLLPSSASGLERDSVANVSQILSVDKSALTEFVGLLPEPLFSQIENGLRQMLGFA